MPRAARHAPRVDKAGTRRLDSGHHREVPGTCSPPRFPGRGGSSMAKTPRRKGPSRREFIRDAALLTGGLAATGLGSRALAQAQTGAPPKLGGQLIGKLEGPELILDPAKWPTKFNEAPMLAEMVKAGKLPPVEQRVPKEPLVIKPVREIGKYGGTWRRGFTGPGDGENGNRIVSSDKILFWEYTGTKPMPSIAKSWVQSDDGRSVTISLRKGHKWSDGKPFTADDFMFWYEDIYRNKDLVPVPSAAMAINGKQGELQKVDTYTVKFKFPEPYYLLPDVLAGSTPLGGLAQQGMYGMGGYAPAHYLKQFHPKYVAQAELDKKVKDAKFDSWVRMFLFKN